MPQPPPPARPASIRPALESRLLRQDRTVSRKLKRRALGAITRLGTMGRSLPLVLLAWGLPLVALAVEKNRFNLPDTPTAPRFKVTDKTWPQKVGEAEICLWHEDKLAALSLGVDDNIATEIDWWKEVTAPYDVKVTWFVISGKVEHNRSGGFWKQFQELDKLGHGVESHSVTHLHMADPGWGGNSWTLAGSTAATAAQRAAANPTTGADEAEPGAPAKATEAPPAASTGGAAPTPAAPKPAVRPPLPTLNLTPQEIETGLNWEYSESIAQINRNVPGKHVSVLAYPGGGFTKYNDRKIAAKYYRTARGARATQNMANQIDYLSLNAESSWDFGDSKFGWVNPNNILDQKLYGGRYYRGWAILFSHQANKPLILKTLEFIKANRDALWVGLVADVSKYGQERDTATLKVESPGPDKITFSLTDEMDDSYFSFPLTVKVRIPNEWKGIAVNQGGKEIKATILLHEGSTYALVEAIPDGGVVSLTGK